MKKTAGNLINQKEGLRFSLLLFVMGKLVLNFSFNTAILFYKNIVSQ